MIILLQSTKEWICSEKRKKSMKIDIHLLFAKLLTMFVFSNFLAVDNQMLLWFNAVNKLIIFWFMFSSSCSCPVLQLNERDRHIREIVYKVCC